MSETPMYDYEWQPDLHDLICYDPETDTYICYEELEEEDEYKT